MTKKLIATLAGATIVILATTPAQAETMLFCTVKKTVGSGAPREVDYIIDRTPSYSPAKVTALGERAAELSNRQSKVTTFKAGHMHCSYSHHSVPGRRAYYVVLENNNPNSWFRYRFAADNSIAEATRRAAQIFDINKETAGYKVVASGEFFNGKQ